MIDHHQYTATVTVSTKEYITLKHKFTCAVSKIYISSYKYNNMDILAIMMMTYSWLKFTVMLLFTIFVVTLYIKIYVLLLYIPLYLHLPDDGSLSPKCV